MEVIRRVFTAIVASLSGLFRAPEIYVEPSNLYTRAILGPPEHWLPRRFPGELATDVTMRPYVPSPSGSARAHSAGDQTDAAA
jgi:hypothetical protein